MHQKSEPTFKNFVKLPWSRGNLNDLLSLGMELTSTSETQRNQLWSCHRRKTQIRKKCINSKKIKEVLCNYQRRKWKAILMWHACFYDFVNLGITDSFNLQEILPRSISNSFNSAETSIPKLLHINRSYTCRLKFEGLKRWKSILPNDSKPE